MRSRNGDKHRSKICNKIKAFTSDLSNLFSPNMYMAVHDSRTRHFPTEKELLDKGFNLDAVVSADQTVTLSLEYTFSFTRKKECIKVQEYIWENDNWTIK